MKFINLNKELQANIKNVYNLKGEDFFLIKSALKLLKSAIINDMEEFNYVKLDAEKLKVNEFVPILETLPLINSYRLIILDNPNAEIVKFLNKYSFETYQVIVTINADKLSVGEQVDCSFLDKTDINKYILNNLAKANLSIQAQALDYFVEICQGNMSKINTELNKIISYAITEGMLIDTNMIANLVSNCSEYVIYMLTNAIDKKDLNNYQKILNEMSKSQSLNEIFSYMGKYFKRMFYVSINKNNEELSEILNIKPYAIKLCRENVKNNGVNYYINLYNKYIDLDKAIKSGKISSKNALYELVF